MTKHVNSETRIKQKIDMELLKILYQRNTVGMPAMIMVALIFYFNLKDVAPKDELLTWLTAVCVMVIFRYVVTKLFLNKQQREYSEYRLWANFFIVMVTISGMMWGTTVYFIALQKSIFFDAFQAFMIAGVTASSIHMLASLRTACLSFLSFSTIPYFIYLMTYQDLVHISFSLLIILYWILLITASLAYHKIMVDSLKFSYMNADLVEDLTHQQKILNYFATHDLLTRLPNRALFRASLEQAIKIAHNSNKMLAVLFLDLDKFKKVNDNYGHKAGDDLLMQVASRIKTCIRSNDVAARISGDEFTVLLSSVENQEQVSHISHRLCESLGNSYSVKNATAHVTVSIGISLYPFDAEHPSYLLQYADTAMYAAKEQGRNNYIFYTSQLGEHVTKRLTTENHLFTALENKCFILHYQPMINMVTGKISGVEALLRLKQNDGTLTMPSEVIPTAEEIGLIIPISYWVVETVCQQMKTWQENGILPDNVSLNLSAHMFRKEESINKLSDIIVSSGIPAENLTIEITESSLLDTFAYAVPSINRLHDLGVKIALDDFGIGYSSFNYLKNFTIDKMKIDQSFIQTIPVDSSCASIVNAIISMAHDMNIVICAEGVEKLEQLEFLIKNSCDEVQGFLFSYPLPADEVTKLLQENKHWIKNSTKLIAEKVEVNKE